MHIDVDELTDHIRRIAQEVVGRSQFKGTLVCTGYNPKTHSVKGIIQPHGVESGWVPIAALHVGNGYGIVVGPKVGDPQKLDGQVFDLHFDAGDPDTLVAHHRQFSTPETPPEVQSGEMLLQHEKGHYLKWAQDGSVTIYHAASGGVMQFGPNGDITHDAKGQNVSVVTSAKGNVSVTSGDQGSLSVNAGKGGLKLAGQSIALTGVATLNGQPIKTGT